MNQIDQSNQNGSKQYMTGSILDGPNKSGAELEQIPEAQEEDPDQVRRSQMSMGQSPPPVNKS